MCPRRCLPPPTRSSSRLRVAFSWDNLLRLLTAVLGTTRTFRDVRAMSAVEGNSDDLVGNDRGEDPMTDQLFAAIRRGKVKPGMTDEFARRVKAGALPAMQKMDGFKGYYLIAG